MVPPQCRGTWIAASAAMTRRRGAGGVLAEKPVSAVEQGRGWGGTWMTGCTWWAVGWAESLTPGPSPTFGEGRKGWPPCSPPAMQGDGRAWTTVKRLRVESWWAGEWVWVRGLAGVWVKPSWRSRRGPTGKATVAMGAALRRPCRAAHRAARGRS